MTPSCKQKAPARLGTLYSNSFPNEPDQEDTMGTKSVEETKALVLEAFDALFNKRNYAKAAEFWSENYIQHSAHISPGRDGLFNLIHSLPDTLRCDNTHIM